MKWRIDNFHHLQINENGMHGSNRLSCTRIYFIRFLSNPCVCKKSWLSYASDKRISKTRRVQSECARCQGTLAEIRCFGARSLSNCMREAIEKVIRFHIIISTTLYSLLILAIFIFDCFLFGNFVFAQKKTSEGQNEKKNWNLSLKFMQISMSTYQKNKKGAKKAKKKSKTLKFWHVNRIKVIIVKCVEFIKSQ